MHRPRHKAVLLAVALALVAAGSVNAQEGKTYRVSLKTSTGDTLDSCVTFADNPPGVLTIQDARGTSDGQWAHWRNGKSKKWFLCLGDQSWVVVGKKVGRKKIKGDLLAWTDDGELMQGTFTGVLDPNCTIEATDR